MTNTTTADEPRIVRKRGHQTVIWGLTVTGWMIAMSLVVHLVVLIAAWQTGFLDNRIVFDKTEEEKRTLEVEERETARQEKEERERAEKRLPEEHARKLKAESETKVERDLLRKIEEIRKARQEVLTIRERKLEQLKQRPEDLYRKHLADRIREDAEQLQREASKLVQATQLEPAKQAEQRTWATMTEVKEYQQQLEAQLTEPPPATAEAEAKQDAELKETAETMLAITRDAEAQARQAVEQSPGDRKPQAEQVAQQAQELREQAERLAGADLDATVFNDTSAGEQEHGPTAEELESVAQQSPAELYETAKDLEQAVHKTAADARAAELAMQQNTTLAEAQQKLAHSGPPTRPDLAPQLTNEAEAAGTVGELNTYRETLSAAVTQAESMRLGAANQLAQVAGIDPGASAMTEQAIQSRYAQMLALQRAVSASARSGYADVSTQLALMWQGRGGAEGDSSVYELDYVSTPATVAEGKREPVTIRIDQNEVSAQALPGRRFDRDSARKGWLYLDTWYIIGPWENGGDISFKESHPPEHEINFDAEYAGKVIDGKPTTLRWQFTQADMIRVTPPMERDNSTYYAYTELFFEDDMEMLLALATDDAAQLWINRVQVWSDEGLSPYNIGEHFRKVFFRRGYNQVLVRIENQPAYCQFSVLICPLELLTKR